MTDRTVIYDEAFRAIGVVCDPLSLVYTTEFDGAGEVELTLCSKAPTEPLFAPDRYICVPDGTMYVITTVLRGSDGVVTVKGEGLLSLLRRTVTPDEYSISGNAGTLLCALFRKCSGTLPASFTCGSSSAGAWLTFAVPRGDVLTSMRALCRISGLGMALEYKNSKLTFSVRSARDRTSASDDPVCLTLAPGFMGECVYTEDFSSYRNVAVVSGAQRDDGTRRTATVRADELSLDDSFDDSAVPDRQTIVYFTESLSKFTDVTDSGRVVNETKYNAAMRAEGAALLARVRPKYLLTCTVAADSSVEPGDTVSVFETLYGVSGCATVSKKRAEFSDGRFGFVVYLTALARRKD